MVERLGYDSRAGPGVLAPRTAVVPGGRADANCFFHSIGMKLSCVALETRWQRRPCLPFYIVGSYCQGFTGDVNLKHTECRRHSYIKFLLGNEVILRHEEAAIRVGVYAIS